VKPAVETAIAEIKAHFTDVAVTVKDDGQGGAYILIERVDLGAVFSDESRWTWIGFHIPFQYPFADVYPHHVHRSLARADGKALGEGMSHSTYEGFGRESVQLSRRSHHRDSSLETALHKLLKVIAWAGR
jgi:hypothetical protein